MNTPAGTPDTRLITHAQDGIPIESTDTHLNHIRGQSGTLSPLALHENASLHLEKDPFVTPSRDTRLSPTASSFTPVKSRPLDVNQTSPSTVSAILSSELGLSRTLRLSAAEQPEPREVEKWLAASESIDGLQYHGSRRIFTMETAVCIRFSDLRDAVAVHRSFMSRDKHVHFDHTEHPDLEESWGHSRVSVMSRPLPGYYSHIPQTVHAAISSLERQGCLFAFAVQETFSDGSLRAIAEFCDTSASRSALEAYRYGDASTGVHVVLQTCRTDMAETRLTATLEEMHLPAELDYRQPKPHKSIGTRPLRPGIVPHANWPIRNIAFPPNFSGGHMLMVNPSQPYLDGNIHDHIPPTPLTPAYQTIRGTHASPHSPASTLKRFQSPSKPFPEPDRAEIRRQHATRVHRSPCGPSNHHNHVDTTRIRNGIDVRTTIMLRNIPNKVDQAMLKTLVDESSWGKYDFMYLRIDFANDCNVGYAFINFVDPIDIVDFVEARGNQRWNCFKSDKVAEISYATIQGKDCLVQKFRNSSVMLEAPHYRPKLYFTSNGPMPHLAGQEEPFPNPDNQSKMKRSCENAEHVGLFTPNAGQHFRDEQRRRRSQFDRGTRLAALEEYDFEATMHHLCNANTD